MAAVTSPWVWRALSHRATVPRQTTDTTGVHPPPSASAGASGTPYEAAQTPVRSMSDRELCRAFRQSFTLLSRTDAMPDRLRVVALRQAYLDEMSRRDPVGFQSWLESGARAASGPERFLGRSRRPDESDAA
jgi:hypothetical protein